MPEHFPDAHRRRSVEADAGSKTPRSAETRRGRTRGMRRGRYVRSRDGTGRIPTVHARGRYVRYSLIMLTLWIVWKERNSRLFEGKASSSQELINRIMNEAALWVQAGAHRLGCILHE